MNYNIPSSCSKKFSNSIDFNDFNYEKSMKNNHSSEALFDKMLLPSANKKNLQLLDLKEEEKLHKNLKNYAMTSRNINKESLGFKLNEDEIFQKKPHKKNDQIPSLNYYFKPQSQNYSKYNNSIDKKHSISFFEPPRYNENNNKVLLQKPSEQDQFINDYIIKKYEIKDKGLENIIEEKEKKDNNFNELNLKKDNLEKENFKLRIENRNLKKSSELLQEEVKFLKEAAHNIDLLSDHDRTIGENIDLKKTKELQAKEIKQLIEDNRKIQKQLMEIKESHEGVTQVNISLEKKMKKEKQTIENNFLQKIQKILEENNKLEEKLKKTENLLKDAHQELKKTNLKSEDDFKALFQSHMEFTSKMEIFGKNYRKNSNG